MSKLQRRILVILAIGIFASSAYLLMTGSYWLSLELARLPGVPLGSLITWAGIVSLPLASFFGFHRILNRETRPARISRSLMICLLLLCAAWGFIAYGLAGNWAFNFSNQTDSFQGSVVAGEIFWAYSKSIVAMAMLATVTLFAFSMVLERKEQ